jgi:hypothetical protein
VFEGWPEEPVFGFWWTAGAQFPVDLTVVSERVETAGYCVLPVSFCRDRTAHSGRDKASPLSSGLIASGEGGEAELCSSGASMARH